MAIKSLLPEALLVKTNLTGKIINITDWGSFGDYVGGLTNPIIALAVLYYVWQSFQTNKKAIRELEKQTKIQKIETKIIIKQQLANSIKPIMDEREKILKELNDKYENMIEKDLTLLSIPDHITEKMGIGDLEKEKNIITKEARDARNEYYKIMAQIESSEKDLDDI